MSETTATKPRRSPTRKPTAKRAEPATPQTRVRHGRFHDAVWERAEERANREGRGVWEVLRQKLAEYADETDRTT